MTALSQQIQQESSSQILNDTDTYSMAVPTYQQAKRSISLYRKSKRSVKDRSRRYSTPVAQNTDYEGVNHGIHKALTDSTGSERKADDALPLLPLSSTDVPIYDDPVSMCGADLASLKEGGHYKHTDSIIYDVPVTPNEEQPRLRTRQSAPQLNDMFTQIEDEEGYVSVPVPMERVSSRWPLPAASTDVTEMTETQEHPDGGAGTDYQNVSAIPLTPDEDAVLPTMLHQSISIEESPQDPAELQAEYYALESAGNLSSLEATSPCPLHAMPTIELYLQSLNIKPHERSSSSLSSEVKSLDSRHPSEKSKEAAHQHNKETVPICNMGYTDENCTTPIKRDAETQHSDLHAYDTLKHEYWRHPPDIKLTTYTSQSPPVKQNFVQRKLHANNEQQSELIGGNTISSEEFDQDLTSKGDHIQTQMFVLQKMQKTLEVMQAAYAHMPNVSHSTETASSEVHSNIDTPQRNLDQVGIELPEFSLNSPGTTQLPGHEETITKCLGELWTTASRCWLIILLFFQMKFQPKHNL